MFAKYFRDIRQSPKPCSESGDRRDEPAEEYLEGSVRPLSADGRRLPRDSARESRWHLPLGLVDLRRLRRRCW